MALESSLRSQHNRLSTFLLDGLFLIGLAILVWFLIGFFTSYRYLNIGYQDWMFQAFQVKSLSLFGVSSWDHIWANGMNHWKLYQYVPHLLATGLMKLFSIEATSAMILLTVIILHFHTTVTYIIFRGLRFGPLTSFLASVCLFTAPQLWGAIREFSIFSPFLLISTFMFFWIRDVKNGQHSYIVPALAGIAWLIHPTFAYVTAGLWLITFSLQISKTNLLRIFTRLIVYAFSASVFIVPYLTKGYYYGNPFYSSSQFIRENIPSDYLGMGLLFAVLLGFSWLILLLRPRHLPKWSKLLLVFISLYVTAIVLGTKGFIPSQILELQYFRATPLLCVLLTFVCASWIHIILSHASRFFTVLGFGLAAIVIVIGIESASSQGMFATNVVKDPVSSYFKTQPTPKGSIFIQDVALSSYFAPSGFRFVNAYFEQMLPSPIAVRFGQLLRSNFSYTGATKKQADIVSQYANVLGVEYIFVPKFSPLIPIMTASDSGKINFAVMENTESSDLAILRNTRPIHYAYSVVDPNVLHFNLLKKPSLHTESWREWDEYIANLDSLILSKKIEPVEVEFKDNDTLIVKTEGKNPKGVLLIQSHSQNWHDLSDQGLIIIPTSERFMYLTSANGTIGKDITIKNSWPTWHWPLQLFGIVSAVSIVCIDQIFRPKQKALIVGAQKEEVHTPTKL